MFLKNNPPQSPVNSEHLKFLTLCLYGMVLNFAKSFFREYQSSGLFFFERAKFAKISKV